MEKFDEVRRVCPGVVRLDRWLLVVAMFALLAGVQSCAERKMTLKEAKQFAVNLEKRTFEPPPRRIDDVLALLDQPIPLEPETLRKAKEAADQDCSTRMTDSDRCSCYFKRGVARYYLGKTTRAQADIRKGLALFNQGASIDYSKITAAYLLTEAGKIEAENGNFLNGIRFIEQGNALDENKRITGQMFMAEIYSMMGNYEAAKTQLNGAIQRCNVLIEYYIAPQLGNMLRDTSIAKRLENQGKYAEAESYRRKAMTMRWRWLKPFSGGYRQKFFRMEASRARRSSSACIWPITWPSRESSSRPNRWLGKRSKKASQSAGRNPATPAR